MPLTSRISASAWEYHHDMDAEAAFTPDEPTSGFHQGMLLDDLSKQRYGYEAALELDADDQQAASNFMANLLAEASPYGRYRATDSFWDLFDTVCYDLYRHGQCVLEVYLARAESDTDASASPSSEATPRLSVIPGWSLRRRRGRLEQQRPGSRESWRRLDEAALVWVEPARTLLKTLQRTRQDLVVLDKNYGNFASIRQSQATGYDLTAHKQRLDLLTARATSALGWDGRRLFMDRATNSFRVYRELKFARSWRHLADATLGCLNAALSLTENPHAPRHVALEGLPTAEEFTAGMLAVRSGSEGLDSLHYRLLYPRRSRL